jgi:hypothetical protein
VRRAAVGLHGERQATDAQGVYRTLSLEAAEADHAYKVAYAKALLTSDGPMDLRKAAAVVATEAQLYVKQLAEARRDAQKELIMTIRLRMDGLRTVSANIRSQS